MKLLTNPVTNLKRVPFPLDGEIKLCGNLVIVCDNCISSKTASTLFLATLQDPAAKKADRLLAAEMAGDFVVINDDLAAALLKIVENSEESEELRSRAVISFGVALEYIYTDLDEFTEDDEYNDFAVTEQMYQRIIKSLKKLYFDGTVPEIVRRRTLEASIRSPQAWHSGAIRAAYQSGDKNWLITAVFCMQYIHGFEQEILDALQSNIPDIHYHAIQAAGNWGITEAWPAIRDVLSDQKSDINLLLTAVDAAVYIGHHEATAALNELLDHSANNDDIVDAVEEALAMLDELF